MRRRTPPSSVPGRRHALDSAVGSMRPRIGATRLPHPWAWFLIGLALLPVALALAVTLWQAYANAALQGAMWRSEPLWFFHLGLVVWFILFATLRGPEMAWLYVFGHEWTHAIFTLLSGGRVLRWPVVRASGGSVVTNRTNLWITLSPYFVPFYAILATFLFAVITLALPDSVAVRRAFFTILGLAWAFHMTFTAWMIWTKQDDLAVRGRLFSLSFILLTNVLVLALLLIPATPGLSWAGFGSRFIENLEGLLRLPTSPIDA